MKTKTMSLILSAIFIIATIQSCKKYSEGPAISLRSKAERVANTWKIENYKINGSDYTSLVAGYVETFSKDGNYSYSWISVSGTGKWAFQNDDKEVRITGIDNKSSQTLYILKLKENQLWYYYMDGNDRKEFHLIPN
jgi:hypothetical protein